MSPGSLRQLKHRAESQGQQCGTNKDSGDLQSFPSSLQLKNNQHMCVRKLSNTEKEAKEKKERINTGLTPAKVINLIYKRYKIQKYNTKICSTKQDRIHNLAANKKLPDWQRRKIWSMIRRKINGKKLSEK